MLYYPQRRLRKVIRVLYAFGPALFAGLTAVLAKCGIHRTDSTAATAIRTILVLLFSWLMVFISGSQTQLPAIGGRTLLMLVCAPHFICFRGLKSLPQGR